MTQDPQHNAVLACFFSGRCLAIPIPLITYALFGTPPSSYSDSLDALRRLLFLLAFILVYKILQLLLELLLQIQLTHICLALSITIPQRIEQMIKNPPYAAYILPILDGCRVGIIP
jgi:hypothetical protein